VLFRLIFPFLVPVIVSFSILLVLFLLFFLSPSFLPPRLKLDCAPFPPSLPVLYTLDYRLLMVFLLKKLCFRGAFAT
jgi:hypothetical protein